MEQRFAWGLVFAMAFIGFVGWLNTGCGANLKGVKDEACGVIDLADTACDFVVLETVDANGEKVRTKVPKRAAARMGERVRAGEPACAQDESE